MYLSGGFDTKHDTLDSGACLYEATHLTAVLSPLYNTSASIKVQKIVRILGTQIVNGRSQNETDGFHIEVSHSLRTGRRLVSGLHCAWR